MTVIAQRVKSLVPRRERVQTVTCPNDHWTFTPRYTDGVCPLDGWKPEGIDFHAPFAARVDWFWPSMIFMAAVSIAMGVLVVLAYGH
jgi:hypothetical protein